MKTPQPRPRQIALTLPDQLREALKAHSQRTGLSVSEIIRAATTQYLDQQAPRGKKP